MLLYWCHFIAFTKFLFFFLDDYFIQFLYKYIKADTQKTTALDSKPTEEIPRIFKMLGYVGAWMAKNNKYYNLENSDKKLCALIG